jgi:flagellar basal body-associated protein FliL
MMPDNKPNNKKKIVLIIASVVAIVLVAVGTVLVLSLVNKKTNDKDTNQTTQTVKTAADIKQEAIELIHSDKAKAKQLLEEALAKYKADGDINGQIDVQSQLDLLEQTK